MSTAPNEQRKILEEFRDFYWASEYVESEMTAAINEFLTSYRRQSAIDRAYKILRSDPQFAELAEDLAEFLD